jgi:hypothetical protein
MSRQLRGKFQLIIRGNQIKSYSSRLAKGWGGGIKENDGRGEFKYDIFDIRTFINATVYPQHN